MPDQSILSAQTVLASSQTLCLLYTTERGRPASSYRQTQGWLNAIFLVGRFTLELSNDSRLPIFNYTVTSFVSLEHLLFGIHDITLSPIPNVWGSN